MTIIYKYPLKLERNHTIRLPWDAIILDIQMQNDVCVLWAIVDINKALEDINLVCIWTGENFDYPYGYAHLKTLTDNAGLVWHIFADNR